MAALNISIKLLKIGLVHTQGHHMTWSDFLSYIRITHFMCNLVTIPPSGLTILLIVIFISKKII